MWGDPRGVWLCPWSSSGATNSKSQLNPEVCLRYPKPIRAALEALWKPHLINMILGSAVTSRPGQGEAHRHGVGGTAGSGIRIFPCKEISQPASLSSAPPEQAPGSTKASHATARTEGRGSTPGLGKPDPRGGRARNGAQGRVRGLSRKQQLDSSGTGKGRCWDWEGAGAGQGAHGADSVGMG